MHVFEDGLPPLRDVIARYDLGAKKSLGQNFLFDLNLTRRIARSAEPLEGFTIVEIGPGPGGLTRALLMEGATRVIAIERDERTLPALAEISAAYPDRLNIIAEDALAVDWMKTISGPAKIVANLPYNVATVLLTGWLTQGIWPPWFSSLTLMFQKEVAERIVAKPGGKDYGRLSVLCQYRCEVKKLFDVNRSAFTPAPKVTSSIVQLVPKAAAACNIGMLEKVTASAFGQRRKMLRSSLKAAFDNPEAVLRELGINPELRAEQLAVSGFVLLAKALQSLRQPTDEIGQSGAPSSP
jgi:16S rRNA (adenine1518-N6/adenine1519-N6)-dimethyltransferase